jgi:hypothetical protein
MQQRHHPPEETHIPAEATLPLARSQSLTETERADAEFTETPLTETQTESVEALGTALSQETRRFRRNILYGLGGVSAFAALMIVVKSLLGEERWEALLPAHIIVSGTMSLLLILSFFIVYSVGKPRRRQRKLTAQVADQYDVRSIGPLIDALYLDDPQTREIAITALTERLPHLKASDADLLDEAQRARLCYLLSVPIENPLHKDVRRLFRPADSRAIAFRVAILQAFAQVGDSKTLPFVERLAKGEARTEGEKRLQEAAQDCLPALQLRVKLESHSRTLLRAAHALTGTETLLRPATGRPDTDPQSLLRPGPQEP